MSTRVTFAFIAIALIFGLGACATPGAAYVPGTYVGVGKGHGGELKVAVTVSPRQILKIEVLSNDETAVLGDSAFEELSRRVIAANSAEVEVVSGASSSSEGFLAAVSAALAQAGFKGGAAKAAAAVRAPAKAYDVIVVGGGGAGLSAANEAALAGASVVVFEKMGVLGGNTVRATGGMNAAGTKHQAARGIADSPELFFKDTMKGGYDKNDPALVKILSEKAVESLDWIESMGGDLSDVSRSGGASVNRIHLPAGGSKAGPEIVKTLKKAAEAKSGIAVFTEAKVLEILVDKAGAARGVRVAIGGREHSVAAKAVVLAAGGFGANEEMLVRLNPALKGFATTNHSGATGDGILLAEKIGAALVDMKEIQTHPTYAPGKEMVTEAVRGNGAILVDHKGLRFGNEMRTRDVVSAAILGLPEKTAYLVFDTSVRKSLKAIEDYVKMGIVVEAASPAELAAKIGVDPAALAATIERYNGFVAAKADADFARPDMPRALSVGPYHAIEVTPAVHHTMGGVKIDTATRVVSTKGTPIPGLFAAGEVTGGVHGGNRLGGNALADIVTFGRIAGKNAAALAKK
ncbi:MAG: flavocytochrome c [Spirochaetaceae bacterium]|nr:flavocytochrome c [Spirochaetaceae bacterium]